MVTKTDINVFGKKSTSCQIEPGRSEEEDAAPTCLDTLFQQERPTGSALNNSTSHSLSTLPYSPYQTSYCFCMNLVRNVGAPPPLAAPLQPPTAGGRPTATAAIHLKTLARGFQTVQLRGRPGVERSGPHQTGLAAMSRHEPLDR
ncbi:Hypothetical protein SMAX5B_020641 [Scophthalmus maximus]|uniref:Uncharacterized protein n=1 Tax=Scophthalmus maximus TaxID=52904 RepID=A0A2U9CPD5_SCOMX|nr:Hypothetical protein SMAX5B_020641 [Scophthalmus maximus]